MTSLAGQTRQRLWGAAFAVGGAFSFYGYITGWPAWRVLLVLLACPTAGFIVWMYTGRFRRYRFLFGIYAAAAVLGGFEAWQHQKIPESIVKSIDLPESPGKPNLYFEYDLPGVLFELFPDEPESLFLRGVQWRLCADESRGLQRHAFCDKYGDADVESIRDLFEVALSVNPKMSQNLYYNYVEILIQAKASQDEIDAAAREWRRLFPLSKRPDPREFFGVQSNASE